MKFNKKATTINEFLVNHREEIDEILKDQFIEYYVERDSYRRYCSYTDQIDQTRSVVKRKRKAYLYDHFTNETTEKDQLRLKKIFELEKRIEELEILEQSIKNIKDVLNKG